MDHRDHKRLSGIFQEIMDEFSEMKPTSLDRLEDKVLDAVYKLGSCLMDTKLRDWNDELHQEREETCAQCGTKLQHKQKERQVASWLCDVNYKRYRSYCPECKQAEYPLDRILEIPARQRMSSSVAELSVLCGASWKYEQSEYIMEKVLRRRCVSHETIFSKTTEVGEAASVESEGAMIKELEGDKLQQGEYFDSMEVWEDPAALIYTDLDGVMINSRDNSKRMEGKVAVVWSKRELVKADADKETYSLVDKRYMGSFRDPERYYWDIVSEVYRRSGGKMDDVDSLVRGDGAPFIRGFHQKYVPKGRYLLDYYHMCKKVKERISAVYEGKKRHREVGEAILEYLDSDDVDGALDYISKLTRRFRNQRKIQQLEKLAGYIERNRHGIWYKEAREKGISIGAGSADKAGDILICRRMKLRGMRWSRKGADAALAIRILVYNAEWDEFWQTYKAA
jgi:hypothetical protein